MRIELERGDIFFFYRPRVGVPEVQRLEDVQRLFFILHPGRGERPRRIVVGSKRLPDPERHERAWAFVADVAVDPSQLRDELRASAHETKTRGTRFQPEARPAGKGRYAIVDHDRHSHLAYVLELAQSPGEAQRVMRIGPEGSYIVAVRNPETPAPPGTALLGPGPALPQRLRERFHGRRFAPLDTPEWLDHERTERVLIGAARAAIRELQIDLDPDEESIHDADLFEQILIGANELATGPLRNGALE